jgi:hypothetical protein
VTDRLRIYNGALLLCKETPLNLSTGLTEDVEARYLLDLVWNDQGVRYCLEQAQWHFAMRFSQFEPDFGFSRAFDKPEDWVSTSGVWEDDRMASPLLQYADEVDFWFCERDVIYARYVSDHADFGMDLGKWPSSFTDYVKAHFAGRICHKLAGADSLRSFLHGPPGREGKTGYIKQCLDTARNKAAMVQPATFPTRGTWAAARHRGSNNRPWRDGGNQNSLIG